MSNNSTTANTNQNYPGQPIYQNSSIEDLGRSRQSPVPNSNGREMNTPQAKFKHNKNILNTDGKILRDQSNDGQLPNLSTNRNQ